MSIGNIYKKINEDTLANIGCTRTLTQTPVNNIHVSRTFLGEELLYTNRVTWIRRVRERERERVREGGWEREREGKRERGGERERYVGR